MPTLKTGKLFEAFSSIRKMARMNDISCEEEIEQLEQHFKETRDEISVIPEVDAANSKNDERSAKHYLN